MGKGVEVDIDQPFELDVEIDMGLDNVKMDMGLDNVKMDMGLDAVKVDMGLDAVKVDMGLDDVKVDMGLDDVKVDMGLDNINVCMSFAIKEFPSMRVHFPIDFALGIKMLGMEVLGFNICGKAMVLTEDNPRTMFYTPTRKRHDKSHKRENDNIKVNIKDVKD